MDSAALGQPSSDPKNHPTHGALAATDSLRASGLSKWIGNKQLLENIDVEIKAGEFCALLGPNGAGKSTLLKSLAGEWETDRGSIAGSIAMNGRKISNWKAAELARQRAVLPQMQAMGFAFDVEELVGLGLSPHHELRGNKTRQQQIIDEVIEATDVGHLRHRLVPTLSGGEAQRSHLARVLAQVWQTTPHGARYLLLDEPTSALDPAHQHSLLATVKQLALERGLGVIVVLHDLNLAALYADRVVMLKNGRLISNGQPAAVLTSEAIREVFDIEVDVIAHTREADRPHIVSHSDSSVTPYK